MQGILLFLVVKLGLPVLLRQGILGLLVGVLLCPALGILVVLVLSEVLIIGTIISACIIIEIIVIIADGIAVAAVVYAVLIVDHP